MRPSIADMIMAESATRGV